MLDKIRRHIESERLLDKSAKHLVALSGGADSVCLLIVLKRLGYDVEAAHCNFHLRGEESDRDEKFCRELCEKLSVGFHIVHFDTKTYAELHKVSIEMAARDLRYKYFEDLRRDLDCVDICVAHHSDDSVETVIMNLVRGTGLAGLQGIRAVNGYVKRPLLCVSRKQITDYLAEINQPYVTDSTNLVNDVVRNKIRLDVIPLLETINPAAKQNIVRMTEWLGDVERITSAAVKKELDSKIEHIGLESKSCPFTVNFRGNCLQKLPFYREFPRKLLVDDTIPPRYLLYSWLSKYGFTTEQITEVSQIELLTTGKVWQSASHTLVVDRECLLLGETPEVPPTQRFPEEGNYVVGKSHGNTGSEAHFAIKKVEWGSDSVVSKEPMAINVDAAKVRFPLTLRPIETGDRFTPYGMKGSKLVSDYMTDRKRNYFEKRLQQVLCDADGQIIWLVGERVDARYAVTNVTINALLIRYYINE